MNYSKVTICNKALSSLSSNQIETFDDQTVEARLCRAQFDIIRQCVLEDANWSFAIKSVSLSPTGEDNGRLSKFALPADCLRVISVTTPYKVIEWSIEGRHILATNEHITIKYIWDTEATDTYSSSFIDAMATRLAAELAYPLTESQRLYEVMLQQYFIKIEKAENNDGQQSKNTPVINNRFTRIR